MKKLFLVLAVVAMILPSCKDYSGEFDTINNRLDKLEQESIPTIDEQISAINTTLGNLDAMDKELKGYIDNLTATASSLQEQINATNTKIDAVKAELQGEISTAKSEVLAQLATAKTELENELAQINATIETLKAKDAELDNKIADLRTYVDTELGKTTDRVNATFATLAQYNTLVSEVATIKEQIKAINESITALETRLTTKINEDIATAVSTLNADIQQKVSEITTAYTSAISTAKEEITSAYTTAIQTAITTLDNSLKTWVGEQLANYYTIAEVEAKVLALQTAITEGDASLQEELSKLKSQLETTATEITAAYKKAIEEAINTNNGVIDTKIANKIASVNQRITNEVATINAKIAEIESRLDNIESKLEDLLARIQSISYIPTYSDGKATVRHLAGNGKIELDFRISPKECVAELIDVWSEVLSCEAVYTQTRAVSLVNLAVTEISANTNKGILSIKASCKGMSQKFYAGEQEARVALVISDGNNSVVSEYIPVVAEEIFDEIWYTSTDGKIVEPSRIDVFDANIASNTYKNGMGILKFDNAVTQIYLYAFCDQATQAGVANLKTIIFPNSVTQIGEYAFCNCTSLAEVVMPRSLSLVKPYAFGGCSNITKVEISDLSAWCVCQFNHSNTSNPLANGADLYLNGTKITDLTIPSDISWIGFATFDGCSSLNSVVIPANINQVRALAFYNCTNLKTVYCMPAVPPTISRSSVGHWNAFYKNASGRMIYVPRASVEAYKTADGWCDYADYIVGYDF